MKTLMVYCEALHLLFTFFFFNLKMREGEGY